MTSIPSDTATLSRPPSTRAKRSGLRMVGKGAGTHSDALPIRSEREVELVGVGDRGVRGIGQKLPVVPDGSEAIPGDDRLEILQGRRQAPADLR